MYSAEVFRELLDCPDAIRSSFLRGGWRIARIRLSPSVFVSQTAFYILTLYEFICETVCKIIKLIILINKASV